MAWRLRLGSVPVMRWEYRLIRFGLGRKGPVDAFQAELNALGAEGWEAVGISGDMNGGTVLLKRQTESA